MDKLPKNATKKQREKALKKYKEKLGVFNPEYAHPDGSPRSFFGVLKYVFGNKKQKEKIK